LTPTTEFTSPIGCSKIRDGPFLELGLKGIVGQVIQLPRRNEDRPDRGRLARRFEEFKKAA
jgi:putative restriction endonuclease